MGKIPGKKHRGVKDPYKQEEARLNKLKDKVNKTPKSIEVQEIPRKLQSITKFNSRKQKKGGGSVAVKKKKKRKKNLIDGTKFVEIEHEQRGMTRPTKMIPVMKQNPNESQKKFLKRVDIMTKMMMKEAAFEDKFQVDVMRDSSGQVLSVSHREKIDAKLSQDPQNISRAQKRTQGKKERNMRKKQRAKKEEDDDEFSYFQDKIKFGEVVYEPPSLNTEKLTRKVNGGIAKPKSFLFMNKLKPEGSPDVIEGREAKEGVSAARHRMVEAERVRAMEAYRKAKEARSHAVSLTGLS